MSIWVFLNFTFRRVQKNERKKIKKMTVCKAFYRFAFFFWSFGIRLFFLVRFWSSDSPFFFGQPCIYVKGTNPYYLAVPD